MACAGCGRPVNQWRCPWCGTWNDTGMSRDEIIALAFRIAREFADGLRRAFRYLRQLGFSARQQCEALAGA